MPTSISQITGTHVRKHFLWSAELNKAERRRLRLDALTFIGGKDWEGCGGLCVTDEMRVTVAAEACLMLLGQAAGIDVPRS
jgi:MtfA peptidase